MWYLIQELGKACPPTVHCSILAKILVGALLVIPALNCNVFAMSNQIHAVFLLFFNCAHCRLEQEHRLVGETRP